MARGRPSMRNPGAAKVCQNESLKSQHVGARRRLMAIQSADAIQKHDPACQCRVPWGTGRFYGLAARVRIRRLEACLCCDLLIQVGRSYRFRRALAA